MTLMDLPWLQTSRKFLFGKSPLCQDIMSCMWQPEGQSREELGRSGVIERELLARRQRHRVN